MIALGSLFKGFMEGYRGTTEIFDNIDFTNRMKLWEDTVKKMYPDAATKTAAAQDAVDTKTNRDALLADPATPAPVTPVQSQPLPPPPKAPAKPRELTPPPAEEANPPGGGVSDRPAPTAIAPLGATAAPAAPAAPPTAQPYTPSSAGSSWLTRPAAPDAYGPAGPVGTIARPAQRGAFAIGRAAQPLLPQAVGGTAQFYPALPTQVGGAYGDPSIQPTPPPLIGGAPAPPLPAARAAIPPSPYEEMATPDQFAIMPYRVPYTNVR